MKGTFVFNIEIYSAGVYQKCVENIQKYTRVTDNEVYFSDPYELAHIEIEDDITDETLRSMIGDIQKNDCNIIDIKQMRHLNLEDYGINTKTSVSQLR